MTNCSSREFCEEQTRLPEKTMQKQKHTQKCFFLISSHANAETAKLNPAIQMTKAELKSGRLNLRLSLWAIIRRWSHGDFENEAARLTARSMKPNCCSSKILNSCQFVAVKLNLNELKIEQTSGWNEALMGCPFEERCTGRACKMTL